ncbi:MAG: hypothetical protein J5940_06040 [Clostridia bacterium]|nr:hypothetical protein [Clostridia bacterium]
MRKTKAALAAIYIMIFAIAVSACGTAKDAPDTPESQASETNGATVTDREDPEDITGNTAPYTFSEAASETPTEGAEESGTEADSSVSSGKDTVGNETNAPRETAATGTEGEWSALPQQSSMEQPYWRSKLTADEERVAYDGLSVMVNELSSTAVFARPVSFDRISKAFEFFALDHPEFFWGSGGYTASGSGGAAVSLNVSGGYTAERLAAMKGEIESVADAVLATVPAGADGFVAEKAIFDWLAANVVYDVSAPDAYSLYGALVGKRCVCEGYAEAFQYLCSRAGVETTSVTGTANNGRTADRHKWNAVKLNGDWYYAEPTWAVGAESFKYLYLNESGYIARSHSPDGGLAALLPELSAKEMSYLNYYGLNFSDSDFDSVFIKAIDRFKDTMSGGAGTSTVLMRADTPALAEKYADLISRGGERITELVDSYNARSGSRCRVVGKAGVVYDSVIFFSVYKTS